MTRDRTAIILAAHDGLQSLCTGVGMVVHSFVEAFDKIAAASTYLRSARWDLYCLAPHLQSSSQDFDGEVRRSTEHLCARHGGRLIELATLSDGRRQSTVWGGVSQWRTASQSAAQAIRQLRQEYASVVCMAHDTIFAGIRRCLPSDDGVTCVWIPHSLGKLFWDGRPDPHRLHFEQESVASLIAAAQDRIGYIGETIRRTLVRDYGISSARMVPMRNGIYRDLRSYGVGVRQTRSLLRKHGVPDRRRLLFAWGRCTPQKGFDVLFPAFQRFAKDHQDAHLVALMPLETSDSEFVSRIRRQLMRMPSGTTTPIFEFDKYLPSGILRLPELALVVFSSRYEGCPLAPLEAQAFSSRHVRYVYSAIAPHSEILGRQPGAYAFRTFTPYAIHRALCRAWKSDADGTTRSPVPEFVGSMAVGLDDALQAGAH